MTRLDELIAERRRWIVLRDAYEALFSFEIRRVKPESNVDFVRLDPVIVTHLEPFAKRVQIANQHILTLDVAIDHWREQHAQEERHRRRESERKRMAIARARIAKIRDGEAIGTLAGSEPPWIWSWAAPPISEMDEL